MAHIVTTEKTTAPVIANLRGDAARGVLRAIMAIGGARIVAKARAPHGSDCDCRPEHLQARMGSCRCVRVLRVRVPRAGDWLLVWGDRAESQTIQLQGPYTETASLYYGGEFWNRVEV